MPLIRPVRWADLNNTRASANLGIGAVWNGVATYTGAGRGRVDLVISAAQAGTLDLLEGDTPGALAVTESWAVPAGTVNAAFPFPLSRAWWQARYTQGAVAGLVAVAGTLDPRAVDHDLILSRVDIVALANTAISTNLAPLGARHFTAASHAVDDTLPVAAASLKVYVATGAAQGYALAGQQQYNDRSRMPLLPGQTVSVENQTGANVDAVVWFYP